MILDLIQFLHSFSVSVKLDFQSIEVLDFIDLNILLHTMQINCKAILIITGFNSNWASKATKPAFDLINVKS